MKKIFISIATICFISCSFSAFAQVGIGTTTPNSKAVLDLKSPNNNQGFLTPRLTTAQRNAISGLTASDNGLLVYDTEEQKFYYWHSPQWETLRNGSDTEIQDLKLTGAILTITNNPSATPINLSAFTGTNTDDQSLSYNATSGLLSLTTLGTPSTVTITSPDNTITSAKIVDGTIAAADLNSMSATSGQVLKYNGTAWAPAADAGLTNFTEADPLVKAINGIVKSNGTTISAAIATDFPVLNQNTSGSAATLTTARTIGMTGDVTWTSAAFNGSANVTGTSTIGTGAITSVKIADGTIVAADLNSMSATSGQVLKFNGSAWAPAADAGLLSFTETDPLVKAINGIVKSNGTTISAAIATDFPTLNQNTTGSAGSAAILTTGRTFSLSGDATGITATAFNGSANATIPVTLANSGVTAGTYNNVTVDAKGRVTAGTNTAPTGTAGGDLTGSYPNPTVTINAITSAKIADGTIAAADLNSMSATSGQVLKYNGTAWAPAADAGLTSFTETDPIVKAINGIVKSNGTTIGAAIATDFPILNQNTTGSAGSATTLTTARTIGMTGDVTWTSAAFNGSANVTGTSTIGTGAVTSVKIADGTIVAADLNSMSAVPGQVLKYNGTAWAPAADNGGASPGLSEVLNTGNSAGGQEAHEFKAVSVNWDVKNDPYGALSVAGSQFVGFTEVSSVSSYTVKPADYLIIADGDAGAKPIQVTLPSAAANKGRILIVRSVSTSIDSFVAVRAADDIDGATTYPEQLYYSQGNTYSITVVSTGKTWLTINRAVAAAGK